MRERCQCAVTERMCANNGRIYADNGMTTVKKFTDNGSGCAV